MRPHKSLEEMFSVGPQLHGLEGIVQVDLVRLDIDLGHLFASGEKLGIGRFDLDRDGTLADAARLNEAAASAAGNETGRVARRLSDLLLHAGADEDIVPLDDIETLLLKKAVARAHGNLAAAARLLGITRPQMVYRLRSRGIAHDSE
jgi:two-component system, NtrC family, response regulator HydG